MAGSQTRRQGMFVFSATVIRALPSVLLMADQSDDATTARRITGRTQLPVQARFRQVDFFEFAWTVCRRTVRKQGQADSRRRGKSAKVYGWQDDIKVNGAFSATRSSR